MKKTISIRLALRHEGDWWNAYLAKSDTMEGARLISSILIGAVAGKPERKQAFIDLMQEVMADGIETMSGVRPDNFDIDTAPESERSGHG
jgi:hypothetical protein